MDESRVRDMVSNIVKDILDKKTAAGLESDVEEALKAADKALTDLTAKLAEVEIKSANDASAIELLESNKSNLETELATAKNELAALLTEKEVLLKRVEKAETELDTMLKDKVVASRMTELESLKVVRVGEARVSQEAVVRDMSDEEYASYRDEMVAIREEFLASIREELMVAGVKDQDNKDQANVEEGSTEDVTPPADIQKALETASTTLPNVASSDVSSDKWKKFSTGFAEYLKNNRGEASKEKR